MGARAQQAHEHVPEVPKSRLDSLLESTMVPEDQAIKFGKLVIQDNGGRMKPINTFSSELLRKLSFKDTYEGHSSDQVFLSMMMNPALWYNLDFIALDKKGANDSIRKVIGVPDDQRYRKGH